jgi:hypothetical protein
MYDTTWMKVVVHNHFYFSTYFSIVFSDVNKLNKIIDILGEGMDTAKLQIEDLIEFVESDDVIPF